MRSEKSEVRVKSFPRYRNRRTKFGNLGKTVKIIKTPLARHSSRVVVVVRSPFPPVLLFVHLLFVRFSVYGKEVRSSASGQVRVRLIFWDQERVRCAVQHLPVKSCNTFHVAVV